jgi:hypothetical protein
MGHMLPSERHLEGLSHLSQHGRYHQSMETPEEGFLKVLLLGSFINVQKLPAIVKVLVLVHLPD